MGDYLGFVIDCDYDYSYNKIRYNQLQLQVHDALNVITIVIKSRTER